MADVAGTWVAARINSSTSVDEVGVGLQCGVKSLKAKHGMYDLASRAEGVSTKAREHGDLRRKQGYTAAMVVEESRILQVSIFNTLQKNLSRVDFSKVLLDVITIADEVDSQLKQAMLSYVEPRPKSASSAASSSPASYLGQISGSAVKDHFRC